MTDPKSVLIYSALLLALVTIVIQSPYQSYRRGITTPVESDVPYHPSMFPTLSLCKVKGMRNQTYPDAGGRANVTARDVVGGNFFTPEELGLSVFVRSDLQGRFNYSKYKGDHTAFAKIPTDQRVAGNCYSIDLAEKVKGVNRIQLEFNDRERVGRTGDKGSYLLSVQERGDDMLAGLVIDGKRYGVARKMYEGGWILGVGLTMQVEERIKNCEPEKRPFSNCLLSYFRESLPGCAVPQGSIDDCPLGAYLDRLRFSEDLHFFGYENVRDQTGCRIPCRRVAYELEQLYVFRNDVLHMPNRTMAFHVTVNVNNRVRKVTETPMYQLGDFLSSLGGLSGFFLGFSLWELANSVRRWWGVVDWGAARAFIEARRKK